MSAPSISQSYRDEFSDNVRMAYQQSTSRLKGTVSNQPLAAQNQYFEFISPVEATQRTGRAQPVNIANTEHFRRRCSQTTWDANDYLDKFEQAIIVPGMAQMYAKNFGGSLGRQYDRLIVAAALGTAYSGRNGTTPVAFDTANQQIAVDYDESGTTGTNHNITTGKIRNSLAKLTGSEALGDDGSPALVTFLYSSSQLQALLRACEQLKVTGTTTDSLASGRPDVIFMGMRWIRVADSILPKNASGYRQCIAYAPDAIAFCEVQGANTAIDWIPEKKSWLVATDFQGDAARLRENGVVSILCDETILT